MLVIGIISLVRGIYEVRQAAMMGLRECFEVHAFWSRDLRMTAHRPNGHPSIGDGGRLVILTSGTNGGGHFYRSRRLAL